MVRDPVGEGPGFAPLRTSARHADLRRQNLAAVLHAIAQLPDPTRVSIASATGLTTAAVGSLVGQLVESGVVAETIQPPQGRGRPSLLLRIMHEQFVVAIIDLGNSNSTVTICDLNGREVHHTVTPNGPADITGGDILTRLDRAATAVADLTGTEAGGLRLRSDGRPVVLVVVAAHGTTDPRHGTFQGKGITLDLSGQLRRRLGAELPVVVENDANLAALGEWAQHRSTGISSMISISGELSVGAGVMIAGRLHRGGWGTAGSVSHMMVEPGGLRCACGRRGCWVTRVGLRSVVRNGLPAVAASIESASGSAALAIRALDTAAQSGDQQAIDALAEAGHWLGVGAATMAHVLDPELVAVGGYFAALARWLMASAVEEFDRDTWRGQRGEILQVSAFATDAAATASASPEQARIVSGGVYCATERLLSDPLAVVSPEKR